MARFSRQLVLLTRMRQPTPPTMAQPVVGRGVPNAVRLALLRGRAWVSGRWVEAASGKTFPVLNPANGELIAEVRIIKFH
jgi:hypothetical protein